MSKKLKGFKEFMKTPRQVPRRIPAGTKYINGVPQDNVPDGYVRVPDHVSGGTKLIKEGVGGALIGGALGAASFGPIGAAAGAVIGHKIYQRASQNVGGRNIVGALAASKAADALDRRAAKKAAAKGKSRFMPGIVSRYLRNIAASKSGGMYSIGGDTGERVADFADVPQTAKPKKVAAAPAPAPAKVKPAAKTTGKVIQFPGKKKATPEMNPAHPTGHPGHGLFPEPIETTTAGQQAAAKRKALQAAVAAKIKAQKTNAPKSSFDAPGTRQKKERVTSSTILVPEEKGK